SGGWDTTARVWNTQAFEPVILLNEHSDQVTALAFSPDGGLLACADSALAIHIWDAEAGKSLQVLREHDEEIRCLAFSPDGRLLAGGGSDNRVRIWEAATGKIHSILEGQKGKVAAAAFSPDGEILASASDVDGMVWLWRLSNREPILVIPEAADACTVETLAFHPQGRLLAVGGIDWLATGG